jgi:hypothetical protein
MGHCFLLPVSQFCEYILSKTAAWMPLSNFNDGGVFMY